MNLGTQTLVRKRATTGAPDEYGNSPTSWDTPATLEVHGCSVQPGGGSEYLDNREAVSTLFTAWAPITADILETDRIEYAGTTYDIDGPIERWNIGTPLDHLVVRLKAVSG